MSYTFLDKIVIRVPSRPFKDIFTTDQIKHLVSIPEIKEAIFLGSPDLYSKIEMWLSDNISSKKEDLKIRNSLLKYILRAHNRSTPFGLFAGCGLSNWSENILLTGQSRSSRLDMNFSCLLATELAKLDFIKKHLKFFPNNSLYNIACTARYIEYYYVNNKRKYQLTEIEISEFVDLTLKKASQGATISELIEELVSDEIEYVEAQEFIDSLIASQILISELEPSICGNEVLSQIHNTINNITKDNPDELLEGLLATLDKVKSELSDLDNNFNNDINKYIGITNNLNSFGIRFEANKLFQVDLFNKYIAQNKDKQNTDRIKNKLIKAIDILNKLNQKKTHSFLEEFKNKFYSRYEFQEVPLLEALDSESGIGYANHNNESGDFNPLIENIHFSPLNPESFQTQWDKSHSLLFKKIINAKANRTGKILITEQEVSGWKSDWNEFHDTMTVFFEILENNENQTKLCLNYVGNSSGAFLLGRFADGNDEIHNFIEEIANLEDSYQEEKLIAEIAHLPDNRIGNVLLRPNFRKYEIPYLSNSANSSASQIPVQDLFLSIRNDKLILRSKSLNKEIIPKLSNAHNYSFKSLPVYHFLCDYQHQNKKSAIKFDWGILKNEATFLPRVEIDEVIVSLATWHFTSKMLEPLFNIKTTTEEICQEESFISWKNKYHLPDVVVLVEGDNELVINLTNPISLNMFINHINKHIEGNIILTEFLFNKQKAFVKDKTGASYKSEVIGFLKKDLTNSIKENLNKINHNSITNSITRTFNIGSEWLYYKLYCGTKSADKILNFIIKPILKKFLDKNLIDKWFFVRYSDPDFHLRIRFHLINKKDVGKIINLLDIALNSSDYANVIWKIQTDSYRREIERYGNNTMIHSEDIFHYDSNAVLDILTIIGDDEELRVLAAIKSIKYLLEDFKLTLLEKMDLLDRMRKEYAKKYDSSNLKEQLNNKFRKLRPYFDTAFHVNENNELSSIDLIFKERTKNSYNTIDILLNLNKDNNIFLLNLLVSYVHMSVNRMFRSKQNMNEVVIYDVMWKLYRSEVAQSQKKQLSTV